MKSEFWTRRTASLGVFSLAIRLMACVCRHVSSSTRIFSISLISTLIYLLLVFVIFAKYAPSYPSLPGFRLSLLSTHVRYCLALGGGRRLLKDQLDGDIATGGIGVGTDRVGDRDQFFAYGPLHSRQLNMQLDL